jgi:hypothetical protein
VGFGAIKQFLQSIQLAGGARAPSSPGRAGGFKNRAARSGGQGRDRGPAFVGHLKVADQRHKFIWSKRPSSCSSFLMYSRITASSRRTVETK